MTATLRQARLEDHPRIIAVVDDWWGGRRMAALLPSLFLEHFAGTSYVAEDGDGELVGFLVGFDSPDHPGESYVHFVGVSPTQRGTGLGRRLHETFADAARERGMTTVRCVTSTQNTASVAFHTSIGFEVVGTDAPVVVDGVDDVAGHVRLVRRL
ncbi:MAG TPA: GNAT family N-acetyltransferase [Candidatus Nanopelagicales bacterium]|nr:GNAT family N-acetyltransferase [Candidatus Nanopelagicales bacterium]